VVSVSNGSGWRLEPEPNGCDGSYHTKTWTIGIRSVLAPKTRHCNLRTFDPIKYLSSDRIVTWSIRRLCWISRSSTCRGQICDPTIIRTVTIQNPWMLPNMVCFFNATQRLLVGSRNWMWEVKVRLIVYNLQIDHITIWSQLMFFIGAKVAATIIWKHGPGTTWPKIGGFMSRLGNNPALVTRIRLFGGSWPGLKPGILEPLLTLQVVPPEQDRN